jgi:hypothetical protein
MMPPDADDDKDSELVRLAEFAREAQRYPNAQDTSWQ